MTALYKIYKKGKRALERATLRLSGVGRPVKKQVLFESFRGKAYSDNPRAISEALHELAPEVSIVWAMREEDPYGLLPDYVKTVRRGSAEYKRVFSTSGCFVTNEALEPSTVKRKGKQLFVQTWHGDRAFKKILYDVWEGRRRPEPVLDERLTDFCVAGSKYGERQYRSAFNYKGEILFAGTPRDDCLIQADPGRAASIRGRLGLPANQKLLLYAPTLRKANQSTQTAQPIQGIDLRRTLSVCEKAYGGSWSCLLRAHPIITGLSGVEVDGRRVIDVSSYPDMADLLLLADALITDYSSCAGDFALRRRPLFLFQDDVEQYQKQDRNFYFKMEESPYLVARSQAELERVIQSTSLEAAAANCDAILSFYETTEPGDAAQTVARRILDFLNQAR